MHCDPAYNEDIDLSDPRYGEDEPESDRISRPDDICPATLRDPNADAAAAEAEAEYERDIYQDHCYDRHEEG